MKGVFRNIVVVLILLSIGYASEVSAQCYRGNQNPYENQGRDEVSLDPTATSNTGVQAAADPNEIIGLDGFNAPESADTLWWVSPTQSLAYTVYFENDAELAMAAASKIPLAHCVRGGMVPPPSGIKPPRKHSLTQTCDNRVV